MKKISSIALVLGAMLLVGTTNLSADEKCGAGKCGGAVEKVKKAKKDMPEKSKKYGKSLEKAKCCETPKTELKKKAPKMKCGTGKCGGEKVKESH